MYNYICETPEVLTHIIDNRKEITHEFVEEFKDKDIEQIYVIGSGTSYHAGLSAKNYLEEVLNLKVFCMYPTQFHRSEKVFNKKTLVIGMSQGGQSLSTVEGLDAATTQDSILRQYQKILLRLYLIMQQLRQELKWVMKNVVPRLKAMLVLLLL